MLKTWVTITQRPQSNYQIKETIRLPNKEHNPITKRRPQSNYQKNGYNPITIQRKTYSTHQPNKGHNPIKNTIQLPNQRHDPITKQAHNPITKQRTKYYCQTKDIIHLPTNKVQLTRENTIQFRTKTKDTI